MSTIYNINYFISFFSTLESSQYLSIDQLQNLERTKKNLKGEFLKLDNGKETYDSFKKKLSFLKEKHMALRITILAKSCWKKKEPLPEQICKVLFSSKPVLSQNELSKENSKIFWAKIEKDLIALFSEEDPAIVSSLERISLVHGTNSAIIPFLPHTEYSLIPTGSLIKFKKIAPMCGELSRGIGLRGINNAFLSLETVRNLDRSWNYANNISNRFQCERFENVEHLIQTSLNQLFKLNPLENDQAWQQEILRLMQLKQYQPDAFYKCIQNYTGQIDTIKKNISKTYVRLEQLMLEALETPIEELKKAVRSAAEQKIFEEKWQKKDIMLLREWHTLKDPLHFDSFLELISYSTLTQENLENDIDTLITHIIKMRLFGIEELINISYFPNTYYSHPVWQKLVAHPGLKEKLPAVTWDKLYKKSKEPITKLDSHSSFPLPFRGFFTTTYRSIQNFMSLSPFTNDEYERIVHLVLEVYVRQTIEIRLNNQLFPLEDTLAQLDHLLTSPSFRFSESDLELIKHPFPLLLASTHHKPQKYHVEGNEFSSRQIPFGKDGIDLIFVQKENLAQMQEWAKTHKLDDQIIVAEITPILQASKQATASLPRLLSD